MQHCALCRYALVRRIPKLDIQPSRANPRNGSNSDLPACRFRPWRNQQKACAGLRIDLPKNACASFPGNSFPVHGLHALGIDAFEESLSFLFRTYPAAKEPPSIARASRGYGSSDTPTGP